ncbi:hypothetical protein TUM17387_04500 [Shewanella carassii]|uniref:hypothetical protein n=1 Tax=Shewanella carassii TaxID=1987584 RepID=UPI001BEEECD6|nr:hypothetical protein [Shewanella carassii]BCV65091.1 hypothetical protein TUM17387_04500 [Shewanella carassii]
MMKTLEKQAMSLICTSVIDAETSMKNMLQRDPGKARQVAEIMLAKLQGAEGQKTRIALVNRVIKQASKH